MIYFKGHKMKFILNYNIHSQPTKCFEWYSQAYGSFGVWAYSYFTWWVEIFFDIYWRYRIRVGGYVRLNKQEEEKPRIGIILNEI